MSEMPGQLSMPEVEALWSEGKKIPLDIAPIALWHLFDPPEPVENKVLPKSEEELGFDF